MSSFTSFLKKYAGEITSVGDVINTVLSVLPIGGTEKAKIQAVVTKLDNAAENILAGLDGITEPSGVSAKDVADQVRAAEIRVKKVTDALNKKIVELETAAKKS